MKQRAKKCQRNQKKTEKPKLKKTAEIAKNFDKNQKNHTIQKNQKKTKKPKKA